MTVRGAGLAGIAMCGAILFSACGDDGRAPTATQPPAVPTQATVPPTTLPPPTTTSPVVSIVSVEEGVTFYPACGNETLEHDGVTWYPVAHSGFDPHDDELATRLAELQSVDREPSPVAGINGFARVAPAGPGDDIGTLVIWSDGVARWVSESGELDVWMIDEELTYNWVC